MIVRALLAFLALPGIFAILVPVAWIYLSGGTHLHNPLGIALIASGLGVLLWCVRDFYTEGKGTLAPWAPPKTLVTIGLYRYTRNPMYLGVLVALVGWAVSFGTWPLLAYAGVAAVFFQLRVVHAEEPWLSAKHGEAWREYVQGVPRWLW